MSGVLTDEDNNKLNPDSILDVADHHTTLSCQLRVNSQEMGILIDSGLPYSIIPNQFYSVLFVSSQPELQPPDIYTQEGVMAIL